MPSREQLERATRTPRADCNCDGCAGLARRYKNDPKLLAFYRTKLLQKGWAGQTDDVEKAYMTAHAGWYRDMQERGRQLAAAHPGGPPRRPKREAFTGSGEASAPADEEKATPGPAPAGQGILAL